MLPCKPTDAPKLSWTTSLSGSGTSTPSALFFVAVFTAFWEAIWLYCSGYFARASARVSRRPDAPNANVT